MSTCFYSRKMVITEKKCFGCTKVIWNWLVDNNEMNIEHDTYNVELSDWAKETLVDQLIELEEAAPEDKRNVFDKYFREDRNYMDYDNWFENVCEQLVLFKETIMSLKPNELLLVGEW